VSVELDSYGFPKAAGIFETVKTIDGKLIALNRHMRRAIDSALELGITMPSEDEIREEIKKVLHERPHPVGRLRLCFAHNLFTVLHDPYIDKPEPMRLNFFSETVNGAIHKQFPYDNRFAILEAAQLEGFDDSILFNGKNEITETAVANVAFLIDGLWVTPPITAGLLPGVMRAIAVENCGVKVRPIHISEIPEVKSALVLSSLRVAQVISHIGEMKLEIGDASRKLEADIRSYCEPLSVG
jgi:branched-subunit amino acid aminotransferase/4-amino-4-deoxychorismate lyase